MTPHAAIKPNGMHKPAPASKACETCSALVLRNSIGDGWIYRCHHRDPSEEKLEVARRKAQADDPFYGLGALRDAAIIGAAALRAEAAKPITYEWEGVVTPGNVVLVGGLPSSGKTTFFYIALCARRNRTGKPITIAGRPMRAADPDKLIVIIQEEHGETSNARKLEATRTMLGLPDDTLDGVIVLTRKAVKIGAPLWLEVVQLVQRGVVDSVWIDSLAKVQQGDSKEEQDQAAVFERVQQDLIESSPHDRKPTVWIVAHARKTSQIITLEDIAGSVQRGAQADVVLGVQAEKSSGRVVSSKVIFLKVRDDDGEWPDPADFVVSKSTTPHTLTWTVEEGATKATLEDRILALLADGPKTENAIREATGRNRDAVKVAIKVLMKAKTVRTTTVFKDGRRRDAYASASGSDDIFPSASTMRKRSEVSHKKHRNSSGVGSPYDV